MRHEQHEQSCFAQMEAIVLAARSDNSPPFSPLSTDFIERALRVAEARRRKRRIGLGTAAIVLVAGVLGASASIHSKVTPVYIEPRYAVQPPPKQLELKSPITPNPVVRIAAATAPNQVHLHAAPRKRLDFASHSARPASQKRRETKPPIPIWTTSVVQTREAGVVVPVTTAGTQSNGQIALAVVPLQRENNQFQLANYENR